MLLQTSRFGEIAIKEEEIVHFGQGIPGFKGDHKFLLITIEESPFMYLQSIDNGDLSFIVVSPFDFFESYEFTLPQHVQDELKLEDKGHVKVINMISVRGELASATINLGAPIVLNMREKSGLQYILPDGKYSIHQPLFSTLIQSGGQ